MAADDSESPGQPHRGSTIRAGGSERAGDSIGPYRLLERLGEGGFGLVWQAERREPFVQRVALKVIKPGMDSRGVIARFDQERQALAVMDHPNVARVLDGGLTSPEQGSRPYFVMEYVKGEPITEYCDRNRLNIRQRLELFIPVCEAVQHAHHKGIIHRDIKPTNVLVTVLEGRLAPKVIDFGVAKAVSHTLTQHTILTEHGQLIGTPEYMSPEQAEMGGTDVDTRTDVYSLGVLLYELLTGQLPFEPETLRAAAFDEIRRIIREEEPPKPSTRLTTLDAPRATEVAARRQQEREELARTLRRELDWIPLKAMRKDRSRRYATPEALAEDIQRYLENKPIEAAPESRAYLFKKFATRYRGPIAAAGAVCAALVLGVVVSAGFAAKSLREQRAAESARKAADQASSDALEQARLAQNRLTELKSERSKAERVAEAVELLGKAEQELNLGSPPAEGSFWRLDQLFTQRTTAESPSADIALRRAFAAAASTGERENGVITSAAHALEGAVETSRAAFGDHHETTVQLLGELGDAKFSSAEYADAEVAYQGQIDALRGVEQPDRTVVARALINLAESRRMNEEEGWRNDLHAAADIGKELWPNDAGVLDEAWAKESDDLLSLARLNDAIGVNRDRLEWLSKSTHEDVIGRMRSVADAFVAAGSIADARQTLQKQITLLNAFAKDPREAVLRANLMLGWCDQQKPVSPQAEETLRRSVALGEAMWPESSGLLNQALNDYRQYLELARRDEDRYAFFAEWGAFIAREGCKDFPTAVQWLDSDIEALALAKQHGRQEGLLAARLDMCLRCRPGDAVAIAESRRRIGLFLMSQGRPAEAAPFMRDAFLLTQDDFANSVKVRTEKSDAAATPLAQAFLFACYLSEDFGTLVEILGKTPASEGIEDLRRDLAAGRARLAQLRPGYRAAAGAVELNNSVWGHFVSTRELAQAAGKDQIAEALKDMERAAELEPTEWKSIVNTLGVTQFRAGMYAECIATLVRSDEGIRSESGASMAGNLAFIAIAHHRLGHASEARAAYKEFLALIDSDSQPGEEAAKASWKAEVAEEFKTE